MSGNPGWIQKGFALLLIIFCMELGVFLLIYPWTTPWKVNFIPAQLPFLRAIWMNGYFRGAVSGLGILNLWLALMDIFRLRRFAAQTESES